MAAFKSDYLDVASGGKLATVGAFTATLTFTGTTGVTFPASGTLLNSTTVATATTPLSVYASGTAYSMTNSDAALDFGTTDPAITIATAGTYLLLGRAYLKYTAATFAANQTATIKLRRTNNTAADVTGATTTVTLRIITTITDSVGVLALPAVIYTATAGDIIAVYGSISAAPAAGSVDATEASIVAVRLT